MSDNGLLIAGTFAMNIAILGGVSYYLHSDYNKRVNMLSSNVNVAMENESNIVNSHAVKIADASAKATQMATTLRTASKNVYNLTNDFYTYYNVPNIANEVNAGTISMAVSSNITIGAGNNAITITGMPSGSSKLMFGSTLSMSAIDNVSRIAASSNIIIGSATSDFMHVKANGKIGINTSEPSEYLDVSGNIAGNTFKGSNLCLNASTGPVCISGDDLMNYVKYSDPLTIGNINQTSVINIGSESNGLSAAQFGASSAASTLTLFKPVA